MKRTETEYSYEHAGESITTVNGCEYLVWADYSRRASVAQCVETGEIKVIKWSGYITNDLTVRKAIARVFGLNTFRK